jgi:mono/diheme cytochrome c family protein
MLRAALLALAVLTGSIDAHAEPQDGAALEREAGELSWRAAREAGLWRFVGDASGSALDGATTSWRSGAGALGTVVVVTSLTCPLCLKFAPDVARVEEHWRERGFGFVHVVVGGLDTSEEVRAHVAEFGLEGLVLVDTSRAIEAAFDARTTTETFVVDARGTLRYRGALSDRFGIGASRAAATRNFLEDALASLAANAEPLVPCTNAPGCLLEPRTSVPVAAADTTVTYNRQIARLVQTNCAACHHDGGAAPFALDDYDAVARRSAMIAAVTADGSMPPWFAAAHDGDTSPWANDRSLLTRERAELTAWIAAGKPRGDDAEAPLPRVFDTDGWQLGTPDLELGLPQAIEVPAEGVLEYRYVAVPTGLERERWIEAIEVRPGAPRVVHHVVVHALPAEAFANGRLRDWNSIDETHGFFAAWVPGSEPVRYPIGTARPLPAGSVLFFELHYTPNGRATSDRTTIGLHFADEDPAFRPRHVVRTVGLSNRRIAIPPHVGDHGEAAHGVFVRGASVRAFMPHMHLRGSQFSFDVVPAGGASRRALSVPRYDFKWQLRYDLAEPLLLAPGDMVTATGRFDNSSANAANPAPDELVRFGPNTDDEMMIGYIEYVLLEEDFAVPAGEPLAVVIDDRIGTQLLELDEEKDGVLSRTQVAKRWYDAFDRLDRNGDGRVDASELPLLNRR